MSKHKFLFIYVAWDVGIPESVSLCLSSVLKILILYLFKYYLSPLLFFFWNPVRYNSLLFSSFPSLCPFVDNFLRSSFCSLFTGFLSSYA